MVTRSRCRGSDPDLGLLKSGLYYFISSAIKNVGKIFLSFLEINEIAFNL
jgi:hypothetical protein